jgi:uncharacterized protein (DUF736 family)
LRPTPEGVRLDRNFCKIRFRFVRFGGKSNFAKFSAELTAADQPSPLPPSGTVPIATLTQKNDGILEGVFATIRVNAPIAIVPNAQKSSEEAPDFRVIHRKTGFEIGAAWARTARQTGEEYLSVKLEAPEIGVIFGNVAQAPGGDPTKKVILWNNPN